MQLCSFPYSRISSGVMSFSFFLGCSTRLRLDVLGVLFLPSVHISVYFMLGDVLPDLSQTLGPHTVSVDSILLPLLLQPPVLHMIIALHPFSLSLHYSQIMLCSVPAQASTEESLTLCVDVRKELRSPLVFMMHVNTQLCK